MIYWRVMMMWMMLPRYPKKNIVVAVVVDVVSLLPYRVDSSRRNCLHRHRQWRKMTTMTMTMTGEVSVDDEAVVLSSSMNDIDQHVYYSQAMTMTMIRTLCSKNNRPPPPPPSTMALGE